MCQRVARSCGVCSAEGSQWPERAKSIPACGSRATLSTVGRTPSASPPVGAGAGAALGAMRSALRRAGASKNLTFIFPRSGVSTVPPESGFAGAAQDRDAKATDGGADGACRRGRRPPGLGQASGRRRVARRAAELAGQPPDRGAGASKTIDCRTARRPRGARAASRARCAGRALDMFFVRPNATGHDLPTPGCGRDERPAGKSHGAARPPRARAGSRGRRTRHAPRPHSPRTPLALALLMPPTSVACRSSSPGRTSANMPAAARPGTFDGSARRRSRLSASRVSVALRVSCTSRC